MLLTTLLFLIPFDPATTTLIGSFFGSCMILLQMYSNYIQRRNTSLLDKNQTILKPIATVLAEVHVLTNSKMAALRMELGLLRHEILMMRATRDGTPPPAPYQPQVPRPTPHDVIAAQSQLEAISGEDKDHPAD